MLLPLAAVVAAAGHGAHGASGWSPAAAWILLGAAVFGAGYGAVQNLTLLAAFARAGEGGTTSASAMWNVSFDAGTAIGALVLGLLAAGIGLDWTYVLVGGARCASLPVASAAARSRPPDRRRSRGRR